MPRSAHRSAVVSRIAIWSALALVLLMLATVWARDWSQQAAPRDAMRRAEASGAYHFAADVSQKTIPLPSVTSIGRRSQDEMFHLEGRTDRSSQTMEMRLWGDGGSVLDPGSGIDLKVQGDETFARRGGQEWQKVDTFTGLFAPQGDFFGLLAAARDFSPIDDGAGDLKRYSFRLDGTTFAKLMRDQLEQTMRDKGQLPPGVNLDLPQMYVDMEGQGELWIGENGLPSRQIIHMALPSIPGRDERVEADITITFAQFAPVAAGLNLANWLPSTQVLQNAIWAALIVALTTILLRKHRSRPVYAVMAGTVVLSLVTSPVLQGLKIAQFNTTNAAEAAERREQQSEADAQRQARDQMLTSTFDPHASPLQPAPAVANTAGLPNLSNLLDSTTDTDADGLPDELEGRIGTSPTADDSDGDSIGDAQETRGFSYNDRTWYLDPREIDSNKDSIDDRREWRRDADLGQTPQDTDGDGTPDLFDADNDNDGVPDRGDLSPFQKQAALGPSQPFQFRVPDLQANTPAFVEFQIRPADTKHLWYALNVLDWPDGDKMGQIQDQDGKTFADVCKLQGGANCDMPPNSANGDMKLVPMLELRMDASSANLPSAGDLEPYGIIVRDVDQKTKLAYVPLAIVVDAQETRLAFSGKMRYKSNGSWDKFHEARLIWMVQVLVDQCTSYGNDAECSTYGALNKMQVVQTYPEESWTLTGLNIREEHGTDVALAYEDPQTDPSIQDDTPIVALTTNLEQSFMVGRDDNTNGKRDIGVTTASSDSSIAGRFDGSSTASAEQRWNMPSYMRVTSQSFVTSDEAIKTLVGTTTSATLQKFHEFRTTAKPLLMFAREDRFRAMNLDAIPATQGSQGVRWESGSTLASQPIQTQAYLNLMPYCFQNAWAACSTTAYWNELERRYAPAIQGTPAEQQRGWGQLILAQTYHMALMHGVSNIVQQANAPMPPLFRAASDQPLAATIVNGAGKGGIFVINQIVTKFELEQGGGKLAEIVGVLHTSGGGAATKATADLFGLTKLVNLVKGNKVKVALGLVAVILATAAVATVVGLGIGGVFGDTGKTVTIQTIMAVFEIGMAAVSLIFLVIAIVSAVKTLGSTTGVFSKAASIVGNSKTAAVLTLLLSIGVTWGVFIFQIFAGSLTPASPAFTMALSQALTGTVLAVLTFVIGLSVGGALALAVIGLVDAVISVVCRAINSQASFCSGIMRSILEELSTRWPLYSRELLPSLGKDSIAAGKVDTRLEFPERGFTESNRMVFEMPLTTGIAENPSAVGWRDRNHKKEDLPRTTFKYELSDQKRWIDAWINDMAGDWRLLNGREPGFNYTHTWAFRSNTVARGTVPLSVGVNRPIPLYLNIGYALPSRTYVWPFYWWDPQGTRDSYSVSLSDAFNFDVFPDTFDKFYTLTGVREAYAIPWLVDAKKQIFVKQKDADGDGLLAQGHQGADPDDGKWDTDGDGLSDAYELKMRAQGQAFSATSADTDGDNLRDDEEARQETNPAKADTDGDGLTDRQEIDGWMITVGGQQFKATSNPRIADADGDGLSDLAEYGLAPSGYHPQVINALPYSVYSSTTPAALVRPGQVIDYTAVLQNRISTQWMGGSITAKLPDALGGASSSSGITLLPDDQRTFTAQFTAPQAASQVFSIVGNVEMNVEGVPGIGAQAVTVRQQSVTTLKLDADGPTSGISSLQNGQRVRMVADGGGGQVGDSTSNTLIVGGMASDPTSRVAKVEVSVNGGAWQTATGIETWTYPLVTSGEGSYTIQTRATDIVGNLGAVSQTGIVVDNTPPQVAPSGNAGYFLANRGGANGRWQVNLTGTVGDPPSSGQAGSGAGLVEVRLVGIGGTAVDGPRGNGWQAATISGGSWSINYLFPDDTNELTGEYRFLVRATDKVGNVSAEVAASGSVRVDNSAPVVTFGWQALPENAIAQLQLDEPAGATSFEDRSGRGNGGQCAGTACPTAGVTGHSGGALSFDGANDALDLGTGINLANQSFSTAFWAKRDSTGRDDYVLYQGVNVANQGLHVGFRGSNQFTCAFAGNDLNSPIYTDTDWHHWACTYDAASRARVIYRDGVAVAQDTATANYQGSGNLRVGTTDWSYFKGLVDEVGIYQRTLAPQEVQALANPLPPGASLMMPMEEPQGVSSFGNLIGSGVGAQCRQAICPLSGFGGHTGRALGFGGSVYASMANVDALGLTNGDFTVAAWVRTGDLSGDRTILGTDEIGTNQGLHLTLRNGKPYMGFYGNDMSGVTSLQASRWYHLVWRYSKDTGEQAIFVDGALDRRETGHAPFQGTGLLNLGRSFGGNYFSGLLDDVMIYSRSLSDQEIASLGKIDLASYFPLPGIVLDTQTMSGVVADPGHLVSGVKQVEYAFVPRSSAAAQASLVANLSFEESAGDTSFADAAGRGNRGQCAGTACPTAGAIGRSGSALQFDGADDALDLGAGINLANQSFSTAFWAKRDSAGRSDYVIYQGGSATNQGLHVGFRGSNQFTCAFYANDLDSPVYADTDWHHWACTYDAATRARVIYRDGVAVAQDIATANFQGSGNLRLGTTGSLYYKGLLDEVAIYQRALSPIEIQRAYQSVSPVWRSAALDKSGAGVASARWSVNVPGDLAGAYRLDLRATDMLGNRTLLPDAWRGEVDTAGPRATVTIRPNPDTQGMWWLPPSKIVDIVAESTNFDEERSTVWCGGTPATRTYSTPADASESPRLIRLSASCSYYESYYYYQQWYAMVTDRYARLATPTVVQGVQGMAQAQASSLPQITALPAIQTLIITPTNGLVLTTTDQLNLAAALYAQDSLRDYTLTVDGATVDTQSWASGALTNTLVTAPWTPAGEGPHVVGANLRDWATPAHTHSTTATVTLDLAPPTLTMPTTVLTQSQLLELGGQPPSGHVGESVPVRISGTAADTVGLRSVEVRTENSNWTTALLNGNSWSANLPLSSGVYTITARAFDVAGRTREISSTVTVDTQPPSVVEPTLGYRIGAGATQPITPGMTLRQTGVTLMLDWAASSDESGVQRYLAGWTTSATPTIGALTPFIPAATRHVELAAGEAQALYAHVVAEDVYGNRRIQTVGPVYVDAPATPDITAVGFHGWMDAGSLLGISRAISETASSRAALYLPQSLHATWDQQALRLAWSGANWQRDGDLFIYLDTKAGGTGTAYNPYPQTPGNIVKLPGAEAGAFTVTPMLADELVWVKDAQTAVLLRWNGTAWANVAQLTADQYQLDTSGDAPITDLRLPFALIGVASAAAANLGMVAFATDEAALRLWAALPNAPGLNSALVDTQGGAAQANQTVVLLHQYLWPALGSGSVPNTGQYIDTDMEVWITADQEASTFSAFDPDLDELWDVVFDDAGDPADYLAELDPGLPRVGNGQQVNYTIHYINHGTATAKGVSVSLEAWRSLRLQGATHEVDPERGGVDWIDVALGDIGPGAAGTRTVVGTINTANVATECSLSAEACAAYPQLALLDALIYDDSIDAEGLPIDWLWVEHQVDILAPTDLTIGEPEQFIPAGKSVVWGWVDDESDVPLITLQLHAPSGAVTSVPCANVVDEDGEWECAVNVGAAANGAQYQLRAQAKDAFGNTSAWTAWQALIVDSVAPTVTLDQETLDLGGEPLSEESYLIGGVFGDNRRVEWVEVCHVATDGQECADAEMEDVDTDGIWQYDLTRLSDADNIADYVLVYAVDEAGNRSSTPARFNYRVDNIGPTIKVDSALTQSRAGQVALKGTVADGGGLESVYIFAQPLDSAGNMLDVEPIWDEAALSGKAWSYTPSQLPSGSYMLTVVAFDLVGNASNQGTYNLRFAGGPSRIYLPLIAK